MIRKSPLAAIVKNTPNTNSPKFPINIAIIEGINPNIIAGAIAPIIY